MMRLLGFEDYEALKNAHFRWIAESVESNHIEKDRKRSKSVAIESQQFVEKMRKGLRGWAKGRKFVKSTEDSFELRETLSTFEVKNPTKS